MDNSPPTGLRYEPAAVIGTLTAVLGIIGAAIQQATDTTGHVNWVAFVIAVLPFVAGLAIRTRAVSRPWLQDVIQQADTVLDALRPVANEVDVPVPPVDPNDPDEPAARRLR